MFKLLILYNIIDIHDLYSHNVYHILSEEKYSNNSIVPFKIAKLYDKFKNELSAP